jgi:hypothetical protein
MTVVILNSVPAPALTLSSSSITLTKKELLLVTEVFSMTSFAYLL